MDTVIAILLVSIFVCIVCPFLIYLVLKFGRRKDNKKENDNDSKHSGDK